MLVETFDPRDSMRMDAALRVRIAVFVDEQGVPLEEEIDQHDRSDLHAIHAIARDETGTPVATGRYYMRDTHTAQIGRMAVLKSARGTGYGTAILKRLMQEAKAHGFSRASLSAQSHAIQFYERLGFIAAGPGFFDCGIPHQEMTRIL